MLLIRIRIRLFTDPNPTFFFLNTDRIRAVPDPLLGCQRGQEVTFELVFSFNGFARLLGARTALTGLRLSLARRFLVLKKRKYT